MEHYRYRSLSDSDPQQKQIRLLTLLPGSNQRPYRFLTCSISHAPVDSLPPYEALSYYWGKPTLGKLKLDIQEARGETSFVRVTRNLYDALCHLRFENRPRRLWVDAVCINQGDDAEKAEQIRLMRRIYQQAGEVIIWLGNADSTSDEALSLIPVVVAAADQDAVSKTTRNIQLPAERPSSFPWASDPIWDRLAALLGRDWFRRAWVVQELAAATKATFQCGDTLVACDDFVKAVKYLISCNHVAFLQGHAAEVSRFSCLEDARIAFRAQQQDGDPLDVLLKQKRTLASEPIDKIFAFHGLFAPDSFGAALTEPNYGLSCLDAYTRLAVKVLTRSRNLDILSVPHTDTKSEIEDLPSWVPDWNNSDPCESLLAHVISDSELKLVKAPYTASGSSLCDPVFFDNNRRLLLQGYIVDVVRLASPAFLDSERETRNDFKITIAHQRQFSRFAMVAFSFLPGVPLVKYPLTGESILEVFWQTLMAGCNNNPIKPMIRQYFYKWYMMMAVLRCFQVLRLDREWLLRLLFRIYGYFVLVRYLISPATLGKSTVNDSLGLLFKLATNCVGHRCMIKTEKGWLGLAPAGMEPGDCVVLCRGGKLPLVVRPRHPTEPSEGLRLLGDCYVHGLTDGRLWTWCEANETIRDIVLV